ncbi:hypothetical protein DKX38_023345 [Salix brachista]|uniref:Uncharacterized protein n=1 Tax=Salix brachista TaxID=2182728 RepID=A0A5N5JKK7_9ROSI|nr:hypothetical protein DKX38_023345 [Salix brachista]
MEALLYQFTLLSNQAFQDKNFDPSSTDDVMKLFEIEAYKSWASMELEQEKEVEEAEVAVQEAEDCLESDMESAMDEFRRFEEEMERMARSELESLERAGESARKMGNLLGKAAAIASKKYMEAALNSATASMKTAWKGLSSKKPHDETIYNKFLACESNIPLMDKNGSNMSDVGRKCKISDEFQNQQPIAQSICDSTPNSTFTPPSLVDSAKGAAGGARGDC